MSSRSKWLVALALSSQRTNEPYTVLQVVESVLSESPEELKLHPLDNRAKHPKMPSVIYYLQGLATSYGIGCLDVANACEKSP